MKRYFAWSLLFICIAFINCKNATGASIILPACKVDCKAAIEGDKQTECPADATFCTAGCRKEIVVGDPVSFGRCYSCRAGTYMASNSHVSDTCSQCNKPSGVELVKDESIITNADVRRCKHDSDTFTSTCSLEQRKSEYDCPWYLTCDDGYYYNVGRCTACGAGYNGNGKTWTLVGNGNSVSSAYAAYDDEKQNNKGTRCVGIEYSITLYTNNPYTYLPSYNGYRYEDHTVTFVFGSGIRWRNGFEERLPTDVFQPNAPYYKFLGYYLTAADEEGEADDEPIITFDGKFGGVESAKLRDNNTLYARYEIIDFNVWYAATKPAGSNLPASKPDTFSVKNETRSARTYDKSWFKDGKLISGYRCVTQTGTACKHSDLYQSGDNIDFPANDDEMGRILYPDYTDCPAGYYCKNNVQNACPGGSTSDIGSNEVKDCYISGGDNGTKFVDNAGNSFNLPAGKTIKYGN